jgi:hypothetical protein
MKKSNQPGATRSFDLVVDKVPYHIDVKPMTFNEEKRFEIQVNGDDGHVFVWDPEVVSLRAIDDDAAVLPDGLEKAISDTMVKTLVM